MLALYEYFVLFQYPRIPETQRTFQIFEISVSRTCGPRVEQRVPRQKPFHESSEMCAEVFVQGRQGEEIVAVEAPSDMSCGAMIEKHSAGIYSSSCAYDLFQCT